MKRPNPSELLRKRESLVSNSSGSFQKQPGFTTANESFEYLRRCWHFFLDLLPIAQLRWRHALGDPSPPLNEAKRVAILAADVYLSSDSDDREKRETFFRFGTASLVAAIADGNLNKKIIRAHPPFSRWKKIDEPILLNYPDVGLLCFLQNGNELDDWDELLRECCANSRSGLFYDTYHCYRDIIVRAKEGDWNGAIEDIHRSIKLFDLREKDKNFAEFEYWEGGSHSNWLCVDFRLAAIIRLCFKKKKKLVDELETIHKWQ